MFKPFVAQVHESSAETTSPCSSSVVVFDHDDDVEKPKEEMKVPVVEDRIEARCSSRRRKSKQKIMRMVHKGVGEDVVVMDKWNWRKYGQKAIKDSPYPRSYYRCSSSGGCHAKKHVEQSKDDPQTFIVTYIADHTHSPPTRRHAQAGRKITKFSSSTTRMKINNNTNKNTPPCSDSMTWTISDPSIVEDENHRIVLGERVSEDSFGSSFDHDWSIWEFDPFFATTSVN
uniref:WRKY transcription factor n=1 Tax=Fagopyrum tataricum TaxID=62330 RepID=A0A4P9Q2P1_FAGTA|nr:WRKY transcription factor [Fagopyrum tataricum]